MANEILLRITNENYREIQSQIADMLSLDYRVSLIDDSIANPRFGEVLIDYSQIISLSNEIVFPKQVDQEKVSYFKISRVFSREGLHLGWFVPSISSTLLRSDSPLISEIAKPDGISCCIVDSDIATGSTKNVALRLFPGADFFAPIVLAADQDLLDIEDLLFDRSLVWEHEGFFSVNYLKNRTFFKNRTSIRPELYDRVSKVILEFQKKS